VNRKLFNLSFSKIYMQEKILKNIIVEFGGAESEKLIDILYKKQNVNEFLIAKKLALTINQTRNMLYKLADSGLVQFIRKKDKKKGGWYTYFWTLKVKRCLLKYEEKLDAGLKQFEEQFKMRQKDRYYYSPSAELEYTEEEAILNDYTCPETGEVLELKDNSQEVAKIKNEMKKIEDLKKIIHEEVIEIEKKEEKVKVKRLDEEKKQKEEDRKKRKIERDKEKKKLEKLKPKASKEKKNSGKKGKASSIKKKVKKSKKK
jgi:transcription factor E